MNTLEMLFLSLISTISAQTLGCETGTFEPCKKIAADYLELTCKPLIPKNLTWYNDCACLNAINLGNCYKLCDSPAADAEYKGQVTPMITELCKVADIDPKGKLPPPSWVIPVVVPSVTRNSATTQDASKSSALAGCVNSGFFLSLALVVHFC